ncbi:MAG: CPBP family intramembrane glutamic endopeptidase [Cyanobacteria bacterium P01_B01_bin.77]
MKSFSVITSQYLRPETGLLFIAFILPSLILYLDLLPRKFFFLVLGGIPLLALVFYTITDRTPPHRLGLSINWHSIRASILPTAYLLLFGGFSMALLPWLMGRPRVLYLEWIYYGRYLGMVIFQELIWRGFVFVLLEKVLGNRKRPIIFWSASLFAFSHIYFRSVLIVIGTGLLGWLWGSHYWKYRSISGPTLAHYVVGCAFILLNYMGGYRSWQLF